MRFWEEVCFWGGMLIQIAWWLAVTLGIIFLLIQFLSGMFVMVTAPFVIVWAIIERIFS